MYYLLESNSIPFFNFFLIVWGISHWVKICTLVKVRVKQSLNLILIIETVIFSLLLVLRKSPRKYGRCTRKFLCSSLQWCTPKTKVDTQSCFSPDTPILSDSTPIRQEKFAFGCLISYFLVLTSFIKSGR